MFLNQFSPSDSESLYKAVSNGFASSHLSCYIDFDLFKTFITQSPAETIELFAYI